MRIFSELSTDISIHALLAESDGLPRCAGAHSQHFYPRSPCGERPTQRFRYSGPFEFLSTLSLRRATVTLHKNVSSDCHFYPRSPCGERLPTVIMLASIWNFYPRSPCGERHAWGKQLGAPHAISIHALLAESDVQETLAPNPNQNFYPRSPCGERRISAR